MTAFRLVLVSSLVLAATILRGDEPKPEIKSEYRRPELLAIAWQQSNREEPDDPNTPVWHPDGRLIEKNDVEWLRDDVRRFSCHWWETTTELRPLVLVFRIDGRAKSAQTLWGRVSDGKNPQSIYVEYPSGTARSSTSRTRTRTWNLVVNRRVF